LKKIIGSIFITSLLFSALAIYFVNFGDKSTVLKYWVQPKTVDYGLYPYRLSILEKKSKLQIFKLWAKENQYKIVISKNNTKPELHFMLGHNKSYSLAESNKYSPNWKDIDIEAYVKKCTVVWNNEGVFFIEPSGHKLFFPSVAFVSE